jgi:predicted transcriptional regulator
MLSVRLPEPLETRLSVYCETMQVSKSFAVQAALEKHLKTFGRGVTTNAATATKKKNPFAGLVGTGNGQFTTEQVMRMTRGEDWNQT